MANTFPGSWNTSWTGGAHDASPLTIVVNGDRATGSYTVNGRPHGELEGTFEVADQLLKGTWYQPNREAATSQGSFAFISDSADRFIGAWSNAEGALGGSWDGTKNA